MGLAAKKEPKDAVRQNSKNKYLIKNLNIIQAYNPVKFFPFANTH
jgi:hypothetical protein